jgi:hypothetical protein
MYNNNKTQRTTKWWTEKMFFIKEKFMLKNFFKKIKNRLFPKNVSKLVKKAKSDNKGKAKKRGTNMEQKNEFIKQEEATKKVEADNKEVETDKTDIETEKTENGENAEKVETTEKMEETPNGDTDTMEEAQVSKVEQTEETGNGVRVEDLVTKDLLTEKLAALDAKLEAVIKENSDLKKQLADKDGELNGMKDKYETKDFGNFQKQGLHEKDKHANSSFDEYAKAFM